MNLMKLFELQGIKPGDFIPTEDSLAKALNVGRPTLREGLHALEALGVVESRQGARRVLKTFDIGNLVKYLARAIAPTADEIQEFLDVRRVLEVYFFPQAMARFSPEVVVSLRKLTNIMEKKAKRGEVFLKEDAEFHREIFRHLDNKVLIGLLDAFWGLFDETYSELSTGRNLPETARCHSVIVDAIEAEDSVLATHLLSSHFLDVRSRLRRESAKPAEIKQILERKAQ
jgi:DNA-binding FadR family transcriptional regulator